MVHSLLMFFLIFFAIIAVIQRFYDWKDGRWNEKNRYLIVMLPTVIIFLMLFILENFFPGVASGKIQNEKIQSVITILAVLLGIIFCFIKRIKENNNKITK